MCIIVYKPTNIEMPSRKILENCFDNNPDGAGYMFPTPQGVQIRKGFMDFENFYKSLQLDYNDKTKDLPFVLHFRIGTQGGNTRANTHPFPLSSNVEDLRQLETLCDVGIAHNGIIYLTSSYTLGATTSDTIDFITDYLSLIIHDSEWYKGKYQRKDKLLIKRLIGGSNKLAIMSKDGHVELIGSFIEDKGCYYSNSTYTYYAYNIYDYSSKTKKDEDDDNEELEYIDGFYYNYMDGSYYDEYGNHYDSYGNYIGYNAKYCTNKKNSNMDYESYKREDDWYDFDYDSGECPFVIEDDDSYCYQCKNFARCMLGAGQTFDTNKCLSGKYCNECEYSYCCPNAILETEVKSEKSKK